MWTGTVRTIESEILARDIPSGFITAHELTEADREEVLGFLAARPLGGLFLRGHVFDNGLVSAANRGKFIGARDPFGDLEGVALVGHATIFEARSESALATLAKAAQQSSETHMLLGEKHKVEDFWKYYAKGGQESRASCYELLFKLTEPNAARGPDSSLRLARPHDMNLLLPIHAEMAFAESGINPLKKDPVGFRERYLNRIKRNRVWLATEEGRLAFKAEVALETPEVVYLEGVHVPHDLRGAGRGHRFLSQVGSILLKRARSLCLLVNENNSSAQALYRKAGFKLEDYYQTIFLQTDCVN